MNLIAAADNTPSTKLIYFMLIFIPAVALTVYTVVKSKRLAEFLEALADERLTRRDKLNTLFTIWKKERRASRHARLNLDPAARRGGVFAERAPRHKSLTHVKMRIRS